MNVVQVVQGGISEEARCNMMDQATNPYVVPDGGIMRVSEPSGHRTHYQFAGRKAFSIEQGKHSNYSVSYAQLVDEQ